MKNRPAGAGINRAWLLLGLILPFLSASCTSNLYIKVLQPAHINVGEHVKTIALVNRTKPQNPKANVVEAVLTGEGLYQDKSGVASAFNGLNTALHDSPRYQIKQTNLLLVGTGAGNIFPAPLPWNEVSKICQSYGADALCVVETFDTDTQVLPSVRVVEDKDGEGKVVRKRTEFTANLRAQVKVGFRLYDLQTKSIRDEFLFTHSLGWTGVGLSPQAAAATLLDKRAATDRVSYVIGELYASRITPTWITVERSYYRKGGDPAMKQAYRMAYVNDWEGAAALWEQIVKNNRGKTAGKAAYNLAIAHEVLGHLDEARSWCQKAYATYGNKLARGYIYVLDRRIRDSQRLDDQMKSVANNE
ncbi:MAG: tetratricopeptide repeat protein [Cytophagales bacterium]|nr:tetratricopeptide repeat protein [Cytophagales bacterium]